MPMPSGGGVLTYSIDNIQKLYASYLPFIKNGAVFIPSDKPKNLGDEVFVAITLPKSQERLPIHGKVVWVNQRHQSNRPAGFAIQLEKDESGIRVRNEIERLLAGVSGIDKSTYTM